MHLHTHPLIFFFIQQGIIIILLAYTSPTSLLRPALFPVVLLWNYYILPFYTVHYQRAPWISILAFHVLHGPLQYLEKLLLSQWSFDHSGPSVQKISRNEKHTQNGRPLEVMCAGSQYAETPFFYSFGFDTANAWWDRLRFGIWTTFSHRYIGSPYQARHTNPYSSSDPTFVPRRRDFLLRRGSLLLASYLLIDFFAHNSPLGGDLSVFDKKHVKLLTRLREVDREEILTRVSVSLGTWVGGYFVIQIVYGLPGFIAVACGLTSPASVRPVFGSIKDADSIRGFWGSFWHQELRKTWTKPARYFVFCILRLPRPTASSTRYLRLLERYLQVFAAFAISGLLHHVTEVAQGMSWAESGATEFCVLQTLGIMIEDGFQWMIGIPFASKKSVTQRRTTLVSRVVDNVWIRRLVGYTWVLLFLSWASPIWFYPGLCRHTGTEKDVLFPFSLVNWVTSLMSR